MSVEKPRRLGRGLEALIPGAAAIATSAATVASSEYQRLEIAAIRPNPYQPRREFKEADLAELQASLKTSGLLQPISVRPRGDGFELISGERRLRAATRLGWTEIPAIVREVDDRTLLTLALVENLQRSDLNAVEEARGYRRLSEEFGFTHQQIAEAVGKDRTSVTQMLRILQLPSVVLEIVEQGRLSAGHARALAALDDERRALSLANEAVARELSVRELERRVREIQQAPTAPARPVSAPKRSTGTGSLPVVKRMEDELRKRLQTDVKIRLTGSERGAVEVSFYSADDLERVLDVILGGQRERA
ncbi:MAG TPA: ParB/RepB/Spo0J family partition protein [Gemmatimonadaceae bacterium]|nr:ParB/RepB/Spo0J family partition protein [Gemmatimonadaceae bacterium]